VHLHLHHRTTASSPTIVRLPVATPALPVFDPAFCAAVDAHLVRSHAKWRRIAAAAVSVTAAGAATAGAVALRRPEGRPLGVAFGGGLVACLAGGVLAVLAAAALGRLQRIAVAAHGPRRAAWSEHPLVVHRGRTRRSTVEYVLIGGAAFRVAGHLSTGSGPAPRHARRIRVTDLSARTIAAATPDASVLVVLHRADAATSQRILRRHPGRPSAA
jgi:hypothetical protein